MRYTSVYSLGMELEHVAVGRLGLRARHKMAPLHDLDAVFPRSHNVLPQILLPEVVHQTILGVTACVHGWVRIQDRISAVY